MIYSSKLSYIPKQLYRLGLMLTISGFISITAINDAKAISDISNDTALKLLFGRYDSNRKVYTHDLTPEIKKQFDIDKNYGNIFYTDVVSIKPFTQNGIKKYFIITETKNDSFDCHICAPIMGLAVISKNGKFWKTESKHQYIEKIGTFGKFVEPNVVKIGKDNYGLTFEDGYTGMGITTSRELFIAKVGEKFKNVLTDDEFYEANDSNCGKDTMFKCYEYKSHVIFNENNKDNFYPITIVTSGTKIGENNKIVPIKHTKKYIFSNGKYNLTK